MKLMRKKKCKQCKKMFTPTYNALQPVCSPTCAIEYSRETAAKNKAGLNEVRNEKVKDERLSELSKQAKKAVHEFIRLRDKGLPCISCGGQWHSGFHAGHRYAAGTHNMIRYWYLNINGQCPNCNVRKEGNYDEYEFRLPDRIGHEAAKTLKDKAKLAKRIAFSFSRHDLIEITKRAQQDLRELKLRRSE